MATSRRVQVSCLDCGYRIDLLIEDALIVELKCVERIDGIY